MLSSASSNIQLNRDRGPSTSYMNQEQFDRIFQFQPSPPRFRPMKFVKNRLKQCASFEAICKFFVSFFPILSWLPSYDYKTSLIGDVMAGLTVGVVHVPQGIAYAILTGVDPVYGLYTAFFGVILYMIFGTSHYVSVGSFAIISLMTGVSCREIADSIEKTYLEAEVMLLDEANHQHVSIDFTNLTAIPKVIVSHEELVQLVTLTSGMIQIVMALFHVEFLASYLSDQLVSGFCTGAAVHVVVVQLNKLVQVNVKKYSGLGYLIRHVMTFAENIATTNETALIISICSFVFLYIGKDIIGARLRKKLPAPIPFELLLVITATAVSAIWSFATTADITVVKEVPVGLPVARLPRLDVLSYTIGPAFEIAFVVVALHLSMCKVFNRKFSSKTDNNQELYALGLVSTLSSFFNAYPISSSLGRSMLNVECGARTQLSAFFTAALLLVVILFLGPLLSALPMCVLAVIIIYSMKGVFQKMPAELMHLWRIAKLDFLIWIVTFGATVVLDVMKGLAVAVVFALLTTVFRIQWPRWHMLSQLAGTEEYRDSGRYGRTTDIEGIRIFRFDAPLLFTNVEHFANSVERAISKSAETLPGMATLHNFALAPAPKQAAKVGNKGFVARIFASGKEGYENTDKKRVAGVEYLIIDCSGFTFIDYTSVSALTDVYNRLRARGLNVYFAEAKAPVRDMLESCGFFVSVYKINFYPTIHDAVLAACANRRNNTLSAAIDSPRTEQHFFLEDGLSPQTPTTAPLTHHLSSIAGSTNFGDPEAIAAGSHRQLGVAASTSTIWGTREHFDVNDEV
uniref:STAS domain-containing protein n=1 Tax=Panagrellus redivivus TaxID=6233 RepID=A0A7E4UYM6_PANRE